MHPLENPNQQNLVEEHKQLFLYSLNRVFHKHWTLPAVIGTNPITALINVDFPAPFGPTIAIIFPSGKSRSTFHNAGSVLYVTERFLNLHRRIFFFLQFFITWLLFHHFNACTIVSML